MARDGSVLVKFLADTLGFRRGTDDMERALDDAARATDQDTRHMATAFRDAGQKINRTTKDIGDGTKLTMKDAGKEAGGEFIQNMGEGIGSGQANLTDTVLGTIGGIAPALGAAGVGVAIGATAALGIINGITAQNAKVRQAASDLFDQMRQGIVDAAAKQDLLQKALGVDNMYDAMAKVTAEARRLGAPVQDVLTYLDSAGRVVTPALAAALKAANIQVQGVSTKAGAVHNALSDAGIAAQELRDQAGFTADAWKQASDSLKPIDEQAASIARSLTIATQRGKELADYAARQYAAGNPAYGGAPGGKRK